MAETATIDSLAIEIGASSEIASGEIGKLASAMRDLKEAVCGGAPKLDGWAKQLSELANAAKGMGDSAVALSKVASAAAKLQALKGVSIPKNLPENLVSIGKAVSEIDDASIDRLDKMTRALQRLANVSADNLKTIQNFKVPKALSQDIAPKSLGKSIGESISVAAEETQSKWRIAAVNIVGFFKKLGDAEKDLGKGINFPKLQKHIEELQKTDTEIQRLRNHIEELQSKMVDASDKQKESLQSQIDDTEESISKFIQAKADLQRAMQEDNKYAVLASVLKNVGGTLKSIASRAIEAAKALGGKFLSAVKSAASAAGNLAKNIVTAPFNKLAQTVSSLKKQFDGLTSSFARVIFYRAVRTIIKEIGDAMKYGEENAYWFSKQFGTATKYISEAYDEYMSATEMMKNQVGAAWATLFANIQPIIEAIINLVSRAAAAVTQFFAALGGKTTYLKATKYAKDWKDETESATEAAKEWKNQILGFDEINRLDEQSDKGRNRASDNTPDYSQMFEEVAVESEIGDLASKMREMWNNQRWKDLGNLISQTLNDLFPTAEAWKDWGRKLGKSINGAIQTAYTTLKGIKFDEWGDRIAAGVNGALEEINFITLGRLLVREITAALDMAIGFLRGLNFHDVGKSIGDFFRGAFDEASEWLGSYKWGDMSAKLWEKIKSLIEGFDIPSFASSLGKFIVTAANSAADFLNGIDFADVVDTVIGSLETFFDNLPQEDIKTAVSNLWEAIKTAFKDSMGEIGKWLKGKNEEGYFSQLGSDFNTGLTELLNDSKELLDSVPWGEMGTAVSDFLKEIEWLDLMKEVFSIVGGKIVEAAKWVFSKDGETVRNLTLAVLGIKLAFSGAQAGLSLAAQSLVLKVLNPFGGLATGVGTATTATAGKLAGLKATIGSGLAAAKGAITSALPSLGIAALGAFDVGMVAFDVYKLNQIAGEYNTAYEAHLNSSKVALENYNKLVATKGKDTADQMARMVYAIDLSGKDLESSQKALVEHVHSLWGKAPDNMWSGFAQGWTQIVGGFKEKVRGFFSGAKSEVSTGASKQEAEAVGAAMVGSIKNGVQNNISAISNTITTELPKNVSYVDNAWSSISKSTDQTWSGVKSVVANATKEINGQALNDTKELKDGMTKLYKELGDSVPNTFKGVETGVTDALSKVADSAEKSINRMNEAFGRLPKTVTSTFREVQNAVQYSVQAIRNLMNFQWSIPRPKIPRITWTYSSVNYGDGKTVRIPQFDVRWFAKGAVLDNPTLFGMGDAGAEALVPLERNTQWIAKVASEMNRQGANTSTASDDVSVIIYTAAAQIVQAINDSANRKGNVSVNVNGREFFRATYDDQKAVARERGVSLVVG